MRHTLQILAGTAVLVLLVGVSARASTFPYNSCGPFVEPIPGCKVPTPCQVPGKEYSNHIDKNQMGFPSWLQVLMWDGQGGVADTFNYMGSGVTTDDPPLEPEVDALANCQDTLYHAVIEDQASLLWSTTADPQIYYEKPHCCSGADVWAYVPCINPGFDTMLDAKDLNDVDGLEVWGEEMVDDSNRFSLAGDPGGIAVWAYDPYAPGGPVSTEWLSDVAIAAALEPLVGTISYEDIDLDAMMTWDADCGDGLFDDAVDSILFSLAPVGTLDGGEIFVWDATGVRYLYHGCHLWDTGHVVQGYAGSASENVNALEAVAVPEPVTLAGLVLAIGSLGRYVRRRR